MWACVFAQYERKSHVDQIAKSVFDSYLLDKSHVDQEVVSLFVSRFLYERSHVPSFTT